jgi:hypothetical protein
VEGTGDALAQEQPDSQDQLWRPTPVPVDWLRNTLAVTGPIEAVERFRTAAAGSGVIPWTLDLAAMEEEWLLPMAGPADGVRAIRPRSYSRQFRVR